METHDAGNDGYSCKNYDERKVMRRENKRERKGTQMRLQE